MLIDRMDRRVLSRREVGCKRMLMDDRTDVDETVLVSADVGAPALR